MIPVCQISAHANPQFWSVHHLCTGQAGEGSSEGGSRGARRQRLVEKQSRHALSKSPRTTASSQRCTCNAKKASCAWQGQVCTSENGTDVLAARAVSAVTSSSILFGGGTIHAGTAQDIVAWLATAFHMRTPMLLAFVRTCAAEVARPPIPSGSMPLLIVPLPSSQRNLCPVANHCRCIIVFRAGKFQTLSVCAMCPGLPMR